MGRSRRMPRKSTFSRQPWSCGDRGHLVSQKLWAEGHEGWPTPSSNCRLSGHMWVERDGDTSLKSLGVRDGMAFTNLVHRLRCTAGPREGRDLPKVTQPVETFLGFSNRNPDGWFCPQDRSYCWWRGFCMQRRAESGWSRFEEEVGNSRIAWILEGSFGSEQAMLSLPTTSLTPPPPPLSS